MTQNAYSSARVLFGELVGANIPLLAVLPSFDMEDGKPALRSTEQLLEFIEASAQNAPAASVLSREEILLRYAPSGLSYGAWLESSVRIRDSHTLCGQQILNAFHFCMGLGDPGKSKAGLYRHIAGAAGVELPALDLLSSSDRLEDSDFAPAAAGLLLGRCAAPLLPEILGYHLARCVRGIPAIVNAALKTELFTEAEKHKQVKNASLCIAHLQAQPGFDWDRVFFGSLLCVKTEDNWLSSLAAKPASPWQRMENLVRSKAEHAAGFHAGVHLDGRPMEQLLADRDIPALLLKMSRSNWIVPGNPDESLLLKKSVQFGGPMFGVFTEAEMHTIKDWITALPEQPAYQIEEPAVAASANTRAYRTEINWATSSAGPAPAASESPQAFRLYHMLLSREDYPHCNRAARTYAEQILARTEKYVSPRNLNKEKLLPYSRDTLRRWVDARIKDQVHTKLPVSGKVAGSALSCDQVVSALTQLAPAALVDGSWLQGSFSPVHFSSKERAFLFEIYRDELGSGIARQHHGNVMRKILMEHGVRLPEVHSKEFSEFAGFAPEAFSMPAYWLSIADIGEFFPEILGLNLAVEMAGVGQGYQAAVEILEMHGIDPYFFVLHNTIDNAASGHTALSVNAIQTWLDSLPLHKDSEEFLLAWKRIWRGFFSYQTASRPLASRYAKQFGPGIILKKISLILPDTLGLLRQHVRRFLR